MNKILFTETPFGLDVFQIGKLVKPADQPQQNLIYQNLIYIARDAIRMEAAKAQFSFFYPNIETVFLPAWDCIPYDRSSPNPLIVADRLAALTHLQQLKTENKNQAIVLFTTLNAFSQKVPLASYWEGKFFTITKGNRLDLKLLSQFLVKEGYERASTVREAGEYTIRGNLVDIFPPGYANPIRIDLFGDEVDTMHPFDAMDQRSQKEDVVTLNLMPVSEYRLSPNSIELFRKGYRDLFGGNTDNDPIFAAVSEGRRIAGIDHWLPLFHDEMGFIHHYFEKSPFIMLDDGVQAAMEDRLLMIEDHYQSRKEMQDISKKSKKIFGKKTSNSHHDVVEMHGEIEQPYKPLPPSYLYMSHDEWDMILDSLNIYEVTPFARPDIHHSSLKIEALEGVKITSDYFAALILPDQKQKKSIKLSREQRFLGLKQLIKTARQTIIIATHSGGARERMKLLLKEEGIESVHFLNHLPKISHQQEQAQAQNMIAMAVIPIEAGYQCKDFIMLSEEDILGERIARPPKSRKRGAEFLSEMTALNEGDFVVHVDHGIGRFEGLEKIMVASAPHDCLRLGYAGGDRLFLPVENLELLSRYGSQEAEAELDRLGAASWQGRKAKSKQRIKDIADKLLKIAAERALKPGEIAVPPAGLWDKFCSGFGFVETEDQLAAIDDIVSDLSSGKVMDRLICGDVGFGKTEVAIRAAFLVAMTGLQVAILAPTTLLARQHFKLFNARFAETGLKVAQLSRLVPSAKQKQSRQELKEGKVDIVIGTHAILSKSLEFQRLGLVIIDEEQHFGVKQKEKLKEIQPNVHFLAMTATPIPRTLQMALSGVRDLSIIATPPVDRMAVRSFVLPFDRLVLSEAIRRERVRGGQVFFVCPRIADLERMHTKIREELAPDARMAIAHGQLAPETLESIMEEFIDGKLDILLSTNIVESGLDIPSANTIILHHADRFGLSQLYQLRGRVGRSKIRAYCYLTVDAHKTLSQTAQKRLEVMNKLDGLGAGFSLASHDMDIRGAGNLLGEAQSGHIKEIGVELYQRMLEDAIEAANEEKNNGKRNANSHLDQSWSPVLTLGVAVMIPEEFIPDLGLRMGLYRRLSGLENREEIDSFAVELEDRFGKLPEEAQTLLRIMAIKLSCRQAGIARLDAGVKGLLISFRNDRFLRPDLLVDYIQKLSPHAKLRPDHKLFISRNWEDAHKRLQGCEKIADNLSKLANSKGSAFSA